MRTKGKRLEANHVPIGFAGNVLGLPATEHRCDALRAIDLRQHPSATGVLRDRSSGVGTSSGHVANQDIATAYFNEGEFANRFFKAVVRRVYEEIRKPGSQPPSSR
jgi:hypothetical protein